MSEKFIIVYEGEYGKVVRSKGPVTTTTLDSEPESDYSKIERVFYDIRKELERAKAKHPVGFVNLHHAYATFLEEQDEMWEAIKKQKVNKQDVREEATQAAAMLIRLIVELL